MPSLGTLTASEITKSHGAELVLDRVSLVCAPGDRIGVVGPNGAGKTTLLRVLAGEELPDAGRVRRAPPAMTVGYLPQELKARPAESVRAYLARRTGIAAAEAEVDRLAAGMGDDPRLADAFSDALDTYVAVGGGDFEPRAAAMCHELGLTDVLDVPVSALSGGQRSRAVLASLLLARFDVFLLDEPTNDLDFEGLERLESFLSSLEAGFVVVSHDRAFLERTIERVVELDEWTHRATEYSGGFRAYLRMRQDARRQEYEAYERYVGERSDLAERARRIRGWAEKGAARERRKPPDPEKLFRRGRIARTEKQASKVRAIERRIERLEPADKPYEPWDLRLRLDPPQRSGHVVVRLVNAVVRRGGFVLGPISVEVTWGDRVRIGGPNGSGKTTLIEAMLGRLPLVAGSRYAGPGVVFGEIDQIRSAFPPQRPLLDGFMDATGTLFEESRTLLAKFGLGPSDVDRVAATLSPGERTRATLALLQVTGVNCLVLDEPTNHLDLPAIEQLEQALESYQGTLLLVTHDRRFAENVRTNRVIDLGADEHA